MAFKTIDHQVRFKAPASRIYEMLMDSEKHSEFTGGPAKIGREPGSAFEVMGGAITGVTLELLPNKRIVQSWRVAEDSWPNDHLSTAIFMLEEDDGERYSPIRLFWFAWYTFHPQTALVTSAK